MDASREIRSVTTGGRRLVEVLDAANADDPWLTWSLPDRRAARSLYSLFLRTVALDHGIVLVTGDPVVGVAVLVPPGVDIQPTADVGAVVLALHGRRIGPALDADAVIDRHRPTDPGWVLHSLAVHPDAQGRGVGSALLEAVVSAAAQGGAEGARAGERDGESSSVSLETANPAAVSWYQRRGFTLDHRVDLGSGWGVEADAPTIWLLSRGLGSGRTYPSGR